jgi:glycosyltransferase involved in cell wall biosynthesis
VRAVIVSHLYADPANRGKLKALAGLGVDLAVAVPARWRSGDGMWRHLEPNEQDGVRILPIPVRGGTVNPEHTLWHTKALQRLLTEAQPDLVHIEEEPWTQPATVALRIARRLMVPSVISTDQSLPRSFSIAERIRRERNLRSATGITGTNRLALALATRRRPAGHQLTLPRVGVTPAIEFGRVPRPVMGIGFLGRLVPERGLDLLFRACVGLAGKWSLVVVGTGPSQEELENLAQRLGISGRVSWLGPLPPDVVEDVWPRLDCVVLPARTTQRWVLTVGRAALQAMAHGVAVVASDSGALPELVGDAGRIVAEEDVPALTNALQELYADRSECERLGSVGRRRVREMFSDEAIAVKTLTFWRSLVPATA